LAVTSATATSMRTQSRALVTSRHVTISSSKLVTALVAGFVATHIATVTGYWLSGVGLANLDFSLFNGILLVPKSDPQAQFILGGIFHYMTGISYGLVYVYLIHPLIPLPNTTRGNLAKGLFFGVVLGLISALWWVPVLFPQFNAGFLTLNFGWKTLVSIFVWHAIWGINIGALYNPYPADEAK
jgi:hypothetical protein